MTNFKEHDGLLFKMLEEPTPLTPDAEMPCLVRLIQDDSPMGKHNKDLHGFDPERLTPKICTEVVDVNDLSDPNRGSARCDGFMSIQYYRYEIIGTFVEEGSKEWAWHQMTQGEKVTFRDYPNRNLKLVNGYIQDSISDGFWNRKSGNEFLSYASSPGWQIYHEPKPEPIFTTGDKVTDGVIEGTIIHIEDAIADVCPSTDEYKIELRNLNHIPESPKQDDVEKPLRSMIAEAKAIGKNIRTYYQDIVFTPQALEACLNQGKFRWWNICNWELTTREQNYFPSISTSSDRPKEEQQHAKEPLADCENCKHVCTNSNIDHCHMYEPKPKSENIIHGYIPADMHPKYFHLCKFKVGDWIQYAYPNNPEFDIEKDVLCNAARIVSVNGYEENVNIFIPSSMTYSYVSKKFITKVLSPAEVVVHIGCLSGTIAKSCDPNYFLMLHSRPVTNCNHSMIRFSALDTETRKLVEGLLNAQKEEE